MSKTRYAIVTLICSLLSAKHVQAQQLTIERQDLGIWAMESSHGLIRERLALIDTDPAESKKGFDQFPFRKATIYPLVPQLFGAPRSSPLTVPPIERGMWMDAMERSLKRKGLDASNPFLLYRNQYLRQPPVFSERVPLR